MAKIVSINLKNPLGKYSCSSLLKIPLLGLRRKRSLGTRERFKKLRVKNSLKWRRN